MLIRTLEEVIGTERDVAWGDGRSRRLLVEADGKGYALTDTYVQPGAEAHLQYDHHLEACYCVEGSGQVVTATQVHEITVGTMYCPDQGEPHILRSDNGMRLVCVFNPPLRGHESHTLSAGAPSSYEPNQMQSA
ncbi:MULTISPECIES: ectoine synthase [unclassified Crossiella]|uniref:ectoine synthase n=1 Tax=unclassified Crossiella TaxID=2620835 RepID=UPI001FFF566C|nr:MULTISPECIES: ectoine synthase [unclassified Crossiella]MCK2244129.1 ectoine synthase [Crossiella sp. S99.2]MCK2257933.1 ectoine synthase [Crossiella sp. S99.1]